MPRNHRRRRLLWWVLPGSVWVASVAGATCTIAERQEPSPQARIRLWESTKGVEDYTVKIVPGNESEAKKYYDDIRKNLSDFPKPTLAESRIEDMLEYFGFPALPSTALEALDPEVIMNFERLRKALSSKEFETAYQDKPLLPDEIASVRFFAPKIINVRDAKVGEVPNGGFGWRKVLRLRARKDSKGEQAGFSAFYLLFNFASQKPTFPADIHAAQIQAILVPTYPTSGKHRDAYFLVYQSLGSGTPGLVGHYLEAKFDLAEVAPADKYYVPRACGQCHGTEFADQSRAKVNYLDTDHWIDRTGDDFRKVSAADVLPDGESSYSTFRLLNTEIEAQNSAVIRPGDERFALLAVRKWLDLHKTSGPDVTHHVPAIRRGFIENPGDAVWSETETVDRELLPLLNQFCFRCHSSVRYHVFQKQYVLDEKGSLSRKISNKSMPQDRSLGQPTIDRLKDLLFRLK